ncbi:MAG: hypothetical protein EYX74_04350 [Desulfobulbaceae bacterium]|nr:MAG: hypothetical protein EYX74_04350 [Desulfobulbaceae bacterium]
MWRRNQLITTLPKCIPAQPLWLLDDHSRLLPHAAFCSSERLASWLDVFRQALLSRGLPRKLYVDNGAAYRTKHLECICASLGIALVHTPPYTPQGRGKIERFFRVARTRFLPYFEGTSLEELNHAFEQWVREEYHQRTHSGTGETPLETQDLLAAADRLEYAAGLGAVASVTGEVGSGKSTALRWVAGRLHPSSHRVLWITATSGSIDPGRPEQSGRQPPLSHRRTPGLQDRRPQSLPGGKSVKAARSAVLTLTAPVLLVTSAVASVQILK